MKTITLKKAFDLIQNCSAVIVNKNALMYPSFNDLNGEPDNEWLYLSWTEEDGSGFVIKCIEENNQTVKIENNELILTDYEGDEFALTLLDVKKL